MRVIAELEILSCRKPKSIVQNEWSRRQNNGDVDGDKNKAWSTTILKKSTRQNTLSRKDNGFCIGDFGCLGSTEYCTRVPFSAIIPWITEFIFHGDIFLLPYSGLNSALHWLSLLAVHYVKINSEGDLNPLQSFKRIYICRQCGGKLIPTLHSLVKSEKCLSTSDHERPPS